MDRWIDKYMNRQIDGYILIGSLNIQMFYKWIERYTAI